MKKIIILLFLMLAAAVMPAVCIAQDAGRRGGIQQEIYGHPSDKNSKKKVMTPKMAQKKQQANLRKRKKEYSKLVKENRKHALEIQTPDVRDRMKNNRKESDSRYNTKRKKEASGSRKAGRKYN